MGMGTTAHLGWCAGRHLYAALTGFLLIYYSFGNSTFHLLIPSAVTYLAMLRLRQHAATLSWLVTFSYLLFWCARAILRIGPGGRILPPRNA